MRKDLGNGPLTDDCEISKVETPENLSIIIWFIRAMHALLIFSHVISQWIECDENDLIVKLFRVIEIFTYIGTILYQ